MPNRAAPAALCPVLYYRTGFDSDACIAGFAACLACTDACGREQWLWHSGTLPASQAPALLLCMYRAQLRALLHAVHCGASELAIVSLDSTQEFVARQSCMEVCFARPYRCTRGTLVCMAIRHAEGQSWSCTLSGSLYHATLRCRASDHACIASPTGQHGAVSYLQTPCLYPCRPAHRVQVSCERSSVAQRAAQQRCRQLCASLLRLFDCVRSITEGGAVDAVLQAELRSKAQQACMPPGDDHRGAACPEAQAERLLQACRPQ